MEIKIFSLPKKIAEAGMHWSRRDASGEIARLEEELGREMTDELREEYKSQEVVRLRTAYLVAPSMRQDMTLKSIGLNTEHVIAYQKEIDELNALSPQELDWRRNRQIRDRIAGLRSTLTPQISNSKSRP